MAPVSFSRWRLDMRRSTPWMCALVMVATSGCKQISDQYAKIKQTIEAKIAERRGRVPTPVQATPQPPRLSADTPLATPAPASPSPAAPAAPSRRPRWRHADGQVTLDVGSAMTDEPSRNEDEYFARRDAELLRQQRASAQQAAAQAERRSHHMKCPKCGYDLITGEWHGIQ